MFDVVYRVNESNIAIIAKFAIGVLSLHHLVAGMISGPQHPALRFVGTQPGEVCFPKDARLMSRLPLPRYSGANSRIARYIIF